MDDSFVNMQPKSTRKKWAKKKPVPRFRTPKPPSPAGDNEHTEQRGYMGEGTYWTPPTGNGESS